MNNNARQFSTYLKNENLAVKEDDDEDFHIFNFQAPIQPGPISNIACFFYHVDMPDRHVLVEVFNYVKIDDPEKNEKILKKLNELNWKYARIKFLLSDEGSVILEYRYHFDNFDPSDFLRQVFSMHDVIKDEYDSLMKVIWG